MKRLTTLAPSISAASCCSSSSDCIAVSRMSVAKGSHSHDTMMMMEKSGKFSSHGIGAMPKRVVSQAKIP